MDKKKLIHEINIVYEEHEQKKLSMLSLLDELDKNAKLGNQNECSEIMNSINLLDEQMIDIENRYLDFLEQLKQMN